jgi:ADP-ribose pyrophosphatase YjhB (NUDIX family)
MTMHRGTIRPLVICLFRHERRILLDLCFDPSRQLRFYRPLGGGIEFGEYAEDALRREIREEISAEITAPRYLFTLENIFTFDNQRGHEIVLVYDAQFVDRTLYGQTSIKGVEEFDGDIPLEIRAEWRAIADLRRPDAHPLFPNGLLERL